MPEFTRRLETVPLSWETLSEQQLGRKSHSRLVA